MVAYDTLRAAIDSYIKANGNKEITGTVLNDILNAMVSALGADTRFAGVAVPTTNPGNPEGNVVYFASQAGTYSNFGGIVLPLGIHILVWNGTAWTSQTWFSVDNTPTQNSQNLATSGGILQAIVDAVGVERLRAIGVEVTSCSFDGTTKKISFFNSANTTLFQLDATAFVIDGMVSDVKIEDGNLVIQFNTDAGKQDIEIPLTDIFNPANYYTKTAIDTLLALYYTKTETDALLTAINNKLADGCLYRGMAEPTTNPPTPSTKVFYIATKAGTYTNFGNIAVTEGITILKYDGSNWSKEQISYSDGVFDISAYNGTSYADLSAALGTNGANIPENLRKGGMSVKFVQSSDNKYVQARCISDEFTTDITKWQTSTNEIKAGSKDLVESGGVDAYVKTFANSAGLPFISFPNDTEASANASISSNGSLTITGGTAGVKLQTSHRYIVVRKYIELGYNSVYMLNTGGYSYVLQIEMGIYHAVGDVVVNDITVPSGTNEVLTIRRGGTSEVPQTVCKVLVLDVTNSNEDEINYLKNYQYSDTDFASNSINLSTTVDDKIEESIVDNLESNNAQKSLSAKQGKVLNSKINSIIGNPFNISLNNIATASVSATIGSDGALTISALGAGVVAEIGHRYLLVVEYTAKIYSSIYVLNSAETSIANYIESGVYHASNAIAVYDIQMISGYKNQISLRKSGDSNVPQSYWKVMLFDVTTLSEANITKLKKANLYSDDMFGYDTIDVDYSSLFVRETLYGVFDGLLVNCLGDSLSQGTAEEGHVYGFKYMYDAIDRLAIAVGGSAVGGSRVSGSGSAFNTDTRVNALNINSKAIVIFGGTNDSGSYTMGDFTQDNYDVNTFVGAYNVLISKIYYKYLKLSAGYYQSVDYSGVTQVENPLNYIPIILVAPPQSGNPAFYNQIKPIAEAVEKIGEMWGLPVISALKETQYNPMISNSPDVHVAINYFDFIGGLITEKLISMIRVFKKQVYKTNSKNITVNNTSGFADNIPQVAYAGDIVSFMIETNTSPTITATAGGNTVSISDLGLYGSSQYHYYQFTMPNDNVTISIS